MLRRLAAATTIAVGALAGPAWASPGPQACIGAPPDNPVAAYSETRQFVEAQAWWMPGPGQTGHDFGHAHVGACIPEREQMTGRSFPLDVKLQLHHNPTVRKRNDPTLSVVVKGAKYEKRIRKFTFRGWTCPAANCVKWVRTTVPLRAFEASGLQEVRFRFYMDEPDGRRMIANLNFQTEISNGRRRVDRTRRPYLRGKGWYTHALYCEASIRSVPIPDGPVALPWAVTVAQETHAGDASLPVTHHTTRLDADFHAMPPDGGTMVDDGGGVLPQTILNLSASPGPHRLVQRADCRDDALGSTNSGVLVVPFVVR